MLEFGDNQVRRLAMGCNPHPCWREYVSLGKLDCSVPKPAATAAVPLSAVGRLISSTAATRALQRVCGYCTESSLNSPWLRPYTFLRASVGESPAARIAGRSPAIAPIRTAEAIPPAQASVGITTAQCLVLA